MDVTKIVTSGVILQPPSPYDGKVSLRKDDSDVDIVTADERLFEMEMHDRRLFDDASSALPMSS